MNYVDDTIAVISSPSIIGGAPGKSIIRISGPDTFAVTTRLLSAKNKTVKHGITKSRICVDDSIEVKAEVYSFVAPQSYTGQDLCEIHLFASGVVVERIMCKVLDHDNVRGAGPGEFTMRAYLNGKMDLSQAEAVAEVVAGSNRFQLAAAEKLLAGKLSEKAARLREKLLDIISLVEAGLDFSTEDIDFISTEDAVDRITTITAGLRQLLADGIRYEQMVDMPSVGLAGAANAGKSSLINVLLGEDRSIVADVPATTRDVLTGVIELDNCNCVLFDCAGLCADDSRAGVIERLSAQAAIEALRAANLVLFCVDIAKDDYDEDIAINRLIGNSNCLLVATKCDLVPAERLNEKLERLSTVFTARAVPTSTLTGDGIGELKSLIDEQIANIRAGSAEAGERIAITQRHRLRVQEAINNLSDAKSEIEMDNDEVAAMLLRSACRELAGLQREDIDEAVLDRIFSKFCIGK